MWHNNVPAHACGSRDALLPFYVFKTKHPFDCSNLKNSPQNDQTHRSIHKQPVTSETESVLSSCRLLALVRVTRIFCNRVWNWKCGGCSAAGDMYCISWHTCGLCYWTINTMFLTVGIFSFHNAFCYFYFYGFVNISVVSKTVLPLLVYFSW